MSDSTSNKDGSKRNHSENYATKIEELDKEIEDLVGRSLLQEGTEEERNEFYRRRNALYSQRKYYRKKMRIERLETERYSLMVKNANLRSQNEVLERTIRWANEKVQLYELLVARNPTAAIALATSLPGHDLEPLLASNSSANQSVFAPSSASFGQELAMPSIPASALGLSGSISSLRGLSLPGTAELPTLHYAQLDQLRKEQQQAELLRQLSAIQGVPTLGPSLTSRRASDALMLQNASNASLPTIAYLTSATGQSQMPQLLNSALLEQQQQQHQARQTERLHLLNLQSAPAFGNLALSSSIQPSLTVDSSLLRSLQASTDDISQQILQVALSAQQAGRVIGFNVVNPPKSVPGNEAAVAAGSSTSSSSEEEDRKLPALLFPSTQRHL